MERQLHDLLNSWNPSNYREKKKKTEQVRNYCLLMSELSLIHTDVDGEDKQ